MELTQERLKELLRYDPDTGLFTWIVGNGRRTDQAGRRAGCPNAKGYIRISVDQRAYMAHRLAWLYMTGKWPEQFIDHENLDKGDNRWGNLREATKAQNNANQPARTSSGLKGAYWSDASMSWQAKINNRYLGSYSTAEEAHAAYMDAAQEQFGEFARA